ncbi:MerR family transcriptional regulator [Chitinilyticum litopenaei]|uniref:MerR family transcriptional regulator n=1 Tax=Chitinilyticum litopenaei TaxID=1121276 RepID=UPI0003FD51BF|nr:MerR family transcriptional regulator [Chitinilyticum litopenaei]
MYIGEVARRTGLTHKAIRLYEARGLIRAGRRGKYRVYTEAEIDILALIIEARALGITLAQLAPVIRYGQSGPDWARIGVFLHEVRARVLVEQEALAQRLRRLDACMAALAACPGA